MARPRKFFKRIGLARAAARKRGHCLWKFTHKGYLKTGYFVGDELPQKILVTKALTVLIICPIQVTKRKLEGSW